MRPNGEEPGLFVFVDGHDQRHPVGKSGGVVGHGAVGVVEALEEPRRAAGTEMFDKVVAGSHKLGGGRFRFNGGWRVGG